MNDKKSGFTNNNNSRIIISGPCSAETESQLLLTAQGLKERIGIHYFRAGIWKPRTKPGMFEGVGEIGLSWLRDVKKETGLNTIVEVANPHHVQQILKYDIDACWIGARTTVSPFAVQEIVASLKGVKIPVFIKNPINPDLELWTGALERFYNSGIAQLGLIHRGFSSSIVSEYRNPPMWQLAIEMKRRFPLIPMLCDPSHICGNRTLLKEIAQKSIDLDYDGLMLESHIDPNNAWSDANQQITPEAFAELLDNLIWRKVSTDEPVSSIELRKIRENIDHIDDELIELLAQRMQLSDQIGALKSQNNITILQTERWNKMLMRLEKKALQKGLSKEFFKKYFEAVHFESINHQNNIMNER